MKIDIYPMLIILLCAVCLILGIFVGRNLQDDYVMLEENSESVTVDQSQNYHSYLLDINSATQRQLQELPGIGEVIAQRIVDYRETNGAFQAVDDLRNVEGIGEKKLNAIIGLICVGG